MGIYFTYDNWEEHINPEVQRYYSLKKHQKKIEKTLSEKSPEYLKKYNELLEKLLGELNMEKKDRKPLPTSNIIGTRKEIFSLW